MKRAEEVRRADVLGGAWYEAETARRERPLLGPGDIQVVEICEREPRPWWAFEMMRPQLVQFCGVIGGIITPMLVFVMGVLILAADTSTAGEAAAKVGASLAVMASAACLFAVGVYALTETNGLDESRVETAGDEVRVAASIVTVIGGLALLGSFLGAVIVVVGIIGALMSLGDD